MSCVPTAVYHHQQGYLLGLDLSILQHLPHNVKKILKIPTKPTGITIGEESPSITSKPILRILVDLFVTVSTSALGEKGISL